jgi:hypothetical protein
MNDENPKFQSNHILKTLHRLNPMDFPQDHKAELSLLGLGDTDKYLDKICLNAKFISAWSSDGSELHGYVAYYLTNEMAYISMLWVSKFSRRRGLAKNMLEKLIELNLPELRLEVLEGSSVINIYKSLGFTIFASDANSKKTLMRRCNSIGVMQPYFFPNLQYFQLVHATNLFVFYDDINYRQGGWINRNLIQSKNNEKIKSYITVPLSNASQNRIIKDTLIANKIAWRTKILNQLRNEYQAAPYFDEVYPRLSSFLAKDYSTISDLAISSVLFTNEYLGLNKEIRLSSMDFSDSKELKLEKRLISIAKTLDVTHYLNSIGGLKIYDKNDFLRYGVNLHFIEDASVQTGNEATFGKSSLKLSIIDSIMNLSPSEVKAKILLYKFR